jgi:TRAP-type mannitol/chloroaromatic compound transport system substrate-binding protein
MPGWHEPSAVLEATVARRAWDPLPDDLKAIVQAAAESSAQATLAEFNFHNAESFPKLADLGVDLRSFSPEIIELARTTARQVVDELAAVDDLASRVHASYTGFLETARTYAPKAELGYLALRQGGA